MRVLSLLCCSLVYSPVYSVQCYPLFCRLVHQLRTPLPLVDRLTYNSVLLHGLLVLVLPLEVHTLVSEVNEGACDCGIVFDPDAHVPSKAKEHVDICEVFAWRPRSHFVGLGVLWDVAIIRAFVPEDSKLG